VTCTPARAEAAMLVIDLGLDLMCP